MSLRSTSLHDDDWPIGMPAAKPKLHKRRRTAKATPAGEKTNGHVLTLPEAAAYLRVSRSVVLELVNEQGLPGRQIGSEWRFLRSALDDWLRMPLGKSNKETLLAMAGNWKDDPYLGELLTGIYEQRGRPMLENDE